jgi:UDP-4-amino-4,6-dideoxy-N-acetyl-beta-L-altrosamine N-acetyltransferase
MVELINFIDMSLEEKKMVLKWRNHKEIRKFMYNRDIIPLNSHLKYIESLKESKTKIYFLVKKENNYIGTIDFTDINLKQKECYLGLYAKPYLKGVGNILMETIIDYAFNTLNIQKLKLEVQSENQRAIKLYKRFQFKEFNRKVVNNKEMICMELDRENR